MPRTYADLASSKVATARLAGGITLTLEDASAFGAPSPEAPMRLVVYRGKQFLTILRCEGRVGNVLSIEGTFDDYADSEVLVGDTVENVPTAGDFRDLYDALSNISLTPGTPGSVLRNGEGVPSDTLGVDGDYYLDDLTGDVWFRSGGVYSVVANIKGPQGAQGIQGIQGVQGPAGVGSFGLSMPSGFAVANSPLTDSGTLVVSTSLSGLLKGTGSGFTAAVAGTDYLTPAGDGSGLANLDAGNIASGTLPVARGGTGATTFAEGALLKGAGAGAITTATAGTDYATPAQVAAKADAAAGLPPGGTAGQIPAKASNADYDTQWIDPPAPDLSGYVTLTTAQTVTGIKTFGRTTLSLSGDSDYVSASGKELVLEQTGDALGATRLRLQNRVGLNGAIFENPTQSLVDFAFDAKGTSRTIRLETRSYVAKTGGPEFQLGPTNTPTLVVGDGQVVAHKNLESKQGWIVAREAVTGSTRTMTTSLHLEGVSGTPAPRTITLPSGAAVGQVFSVVDETGTASTNNVTLKAPTGGSVNGASQVVINADYGALTVYHAGSNAYFILGRS